MRSVEIFYNFMIMDANMNVLWHNPDRVSPDQSSRMDKAWGDHSWRDAAYTKVPGLFGDIEQKTNMNLSPKHFENGCKKWQVLSSYPLPCQ